MYDISHEYYGRRTSNLGWSKRLHLGTKSEVHTYSISQGHINSTTVCNISSTVFFFNVTHTGPVRARTALHGTGSATDRVES